LRRPDQTGDPGRGSSRNFPLPSQSISKVRALGSLCGLRLGPDNASRDSAPSLLSLPPSVWIRPFTSILLPPLSSSATSPSPHRRSALRSAGRFSPHVSLGSTTSSGTKTPEKRPQEDSVDSRPSSTAFVLPQPSPSMIADTLRSSARLCSHPSRPPSRVSSRRSRLHSARQRLPPASARSSASLLRRQPPRGWRRRCSGGSRRQRHSTSARTPNAL